MRHILYFTAEWCNPCKRVRPIAEELDRDNVIKFQFIDADDNVDLCRKFEIKAIPTFVLIENGNHRIANLFKYSNESNFKRVH